jgi:hypothetical protein
MRVATVIHVCLPVYRRSGVPRSIAGFVERGTRDT